MISGLSRLTRCASAGLVVSFAALVGSTAHADLGEHIGPEFFGGATSVRDTCQALASTRPSRLLASSLLDPMATQITDCLQLLREALQAITTGTLRSTRDGIADLSPRGARNRQLLATYRAVQQLKPWVFWSGSKPEASPSPVAELTSIETDTLTALNARGLLGAKYSVLLQGGFGQSDPGGYSGRAPGAGSQGSTSAVIDLSMETEHVDIGGGFACRQDSGWCSLAAWTS
jgi:hypothetical protein